jgi:ribosomal protein S30
LSTYNELMHIDLEKLEAERFMLQPDQARAMLTKAGTVRKRAPKRQATKEAAKTPTIVSKPKPKVKRPDVVLHLTEAQERAFANYMEGKKL